MPRVYINQETGRLSLNPGDYGQDKDDNWIVCVPSGHRGNITTWDIEEHVDCTITARPSILITTRITDDGEPYDKELWHGYLTKGQFKAC